jgi:hypothetical protein
MNMLKKGPELKMPDLKVPDFLLDIYYDLRERHLLPLVAVLLVALVALPFVLGRSSSSSEAETQAEGAVATPSIAMPTSELLVAKAAPGLRDYRKRLRGQHATDPFIQKYAGGGSESGVGTAPTSSEESTSGSAETTEPKEATEGGGEEAPVGQEGDNGEPPEDGQLKYYSWAIDVRVTPVSSAKGKDKPEPTTRHDLPDMTMLPSRDVPALTFIGVTKDERRAVMLVSDKVTGLFGDGICIVGSEACQLIALEPGLPETVVYGLDNRTYRIELLKLHLLKTDELNVAPLGKSKQKSKTD